MFGEYVSSNYGTVDTLTLRDGRKVEVSAVDGDSPYIVSRNNPHCHCASARPNGLSWDGLTATGPTEEKSLVFMLVMTTIVPLTMGVVSGYITAKVSDSLF